MKEIFRKAGLIYFCLVLLFSGCEKDDLTSVTFPDDETPSWDFPVKPGSDEWKAFQSHDEMVKACQIPENILVKLQTAELIKICLNYPLWMDIFVFNLLSDGFKSYETNFNGFRELLSRKDAGTETLAYYRKINPESEVFSSSIDFVYRMSVVELFLSHQQIATKYSSVQKKDVIAELLTKHPKFRQQTSYLAMINLIQYDNRSILAPEAKKLSVYFSGSFLPDKEFITQADKLINLYMSRR
jgi:hypothetical protein